MPPRCPHGRQRYFCRECGGGGFCEHGRYRSRCIECGGSGLCEHGRQRSKCSECVVFLSAWAVDENDLDGDEEALGLEAEIVSVKVVTTGGQSRKRKR